jgi:hypothetical protein
MCLIITNRRDGIWGRMKVRVGVTVPVVDVLVFADEDCIVLTRILQVIV